MEVLFCVNELRGRPQGVLAAGSVQTMSTQCLRGNAKSQHRSIAAIYAASHPVLLHAPGVAFGLGPPHAAGAAPLAKLLQSGFTVVTRTKKGVSAAPPLPQAGHWFQWRLQTRVKEA